ncbi:hypothetical protein [Acinetobacter junii]|uniref:hypothetical protein n=1 Tax=Acinetobacter junii TaxID=40215 RepID=UPI003015E8E6
MQEYPKALYFGSVQAHQHKVVNGIEHEAELRELGFVDFADLEKEIEKWSGESAGAASTEDFKNAFVPIEQFDDVVADLEQKKQELIIVREERDQFKAENDDLKGQLHQAHEANKEVQQALDSLKTETATSDNAEGTVDYSSMTSDQLRSILDEKGIKYLARDNKETLLALLSQPIKTEE